MRPSHYTGPGTYLWLVRHDLRLGWRGFTDMFAHFSPATATLMALAGVIGLHLLAWPAAVWLKPILASPASEAQIVVVLGCIMAWIVAQGLLGVTRLLFNRGDLDLLLGSPLPGTRVFAARATALAADAFAAVGLLTLPVADVGALIDAPAWLSAWPVLAAMALAGTAVGIALGMALFVLVGPRHARLIAQLGAAAIAGVFVLGVQVIALLPVPLRTAIMAAVGAGGGALAPGHAAEFPIAALRGDPAALAVLVGSALTLFGLASAALGAVFVRASLSAIGAPGEGGLWSGDEAASPAFRAGVRPSLRRKEWRLMRRDPNLIAQLSLQMIYTVPVAVVLLNSNAGVPIVLAVGPALVVIATQLAASLSWIAVSGEDAPELIAAAPVERNLVDCAKLSAIALPVGLILALPLAGLAMLSPWSALVTLACAAGGGISTGLLNLWHPMPGKRRGMLRRHSQSKIVGLVEHGLALLWAVIMVLVLIGTVVAAVPFAMVLGVLWAWYPGRPQLGLIPAAATTRALLPISART